MSTDMKTRDLLGPFIGNVTETSVKLWLHAPHLAPGESLSLAVTLHRAELDEKGRAIYEGQPTAEVARGTLVVAYDDLNVGVVTLDGLEPGATYYYRLLHMDEGVTGAGEPAGGTLRPAELPGLTNRDLFFRTLPEGGYKNQLDFLLMSCHNPDTAKKTDGFKGFGVWAQIPQIMSSNENVRFAILAGDQAYGDEIETQVLKEPDLRRRQELYLGVYRKFWDNEHYRRVL